SIGISAEANGALSPAVVQRHEAMIANAHTLLLQLEVPLESVFEAARLARAHGTRVVLNPAPARPLSNDLLALVDLITPNQTEAELLTGVKVTDEASAREAAARFHQMGIAEVMITLGSQGVYCSNGQQQQLIPGFRVEAVDTTAAGDTFNGALLAAELAGAEFSDAVRFAHGAAALSVTKFGAQSSIPSKAEVDAFLLAQAAPGH
ncbi:MAG: PfkB family carbohydrate kinase, partial [Aeromonas sobria]